MSNTNVANVAAVVTRVSTRFIPFANHTWEVVAGFEPHTQGWEMPAETARLIMTDLASATTTGGTGGTPREVSLLLSDATGEVITIKRVIVKGIAAADNDQRLILLLTDIRWYFEYAHLVLDVNLHKYLCERNLQSGETLKNVSTADGIGYFDWSLNNGVPFNWVSYKNAMVAYLGGALHGRPAVTFVTDTFKAVDVTAGNAKVIQETITDTVSTAAMAMILGSIPSAGLYPHIDGTLHIYDATPGAEIDFFKNHLTAPKLMGHGSLVLKDNIALRPNPNSDGPWRMYTDIEAELRFTLTQAVSPIGTDWGIPYADNPYLTPVIQVTDKFLSVTGTDPLTGGAATRTVGENSWVSQAEAFQAWGVPSFNPRNLPPITDDIIANNIIGGGLMAYASQFGDFEDDPIWAGRIGSVYRHWRTTYRVNPRAWSKIRHAWARRTAVWDPVTGSRAKAPVYANYAYKHYLQPASQSDYRVATQVTSSYAVSGFVNEGTPSGFGIRIIDESQGIIAIDRSAWNIFPNVAQIYLSPTIPNPKTPPGFQRTEAGLQGYVPSLQWNMATIFACSPSAPNSLARLHETKVSWADAIGAAGLLPGSTGAGGGLAPSTGAGPDHEMRSRITSAKFTWPEGESPTDVQDVLTRFGIFQPADYADPTTIPNLMLRSQTNLQPINFKSELRPLALAMAAADLLNNLDHYEGTVTYPMATGFVPLGSITSIIHGVRDGRATSTLTCRARTKPYNFMDFLQGSARTFILYEIQQGRQ